MSKCKCKWRCKGIVLNDKCTRVIRRYFCEIDSYDPGIGCNRNCNGYEKEPQND